MSEIGRQIMSGHCAHPQTAEPNLSHERCQNMGGGSHANPDGVFYPCPCECHLGERYECECGGTVAEALNLPPYEDGEPRYVHVDRDGRAGSEFCA